MNPDLMAMLAQAGGGGGAPAAPPQGGPGPGGLPPELLALLGGAAGPEGAGPEGRPSVTDGSPGGGEDALAQAIDLIQQAIDAEADQEDIQVMLTCQTKLQQILAKNQAQADEALSGKVTPKAVRKMAPGPGVPGGGGY